MRKCNHCGALFNAHTIRFDGSIVRGDDIEIAYAICPECEQRVNLWRSTNIGGQIISEQIKPRAILSQRIEDADLSVRCRRCLEYASVVTFGDLVQYRRADMLKFRNFGERSLAELDALLDRNGLKWKN